MNISANDSSAEAGPGPGSTAAPTWLEQVAGVFTGPVPLFRRLADAPRWGLALGSIMGLTIAMVLIWASRVDPDALLRPVLARDPRIAPDQVSAIIAIQGRLLGWFGVAGVLLGQPLVTLFLAALYWLVARAGGGPGFRQALCAAVVPQLATLPKLLLVSCLCLVRPVRGQLPEQLSPFSLGAWFHPGQARVAALLQGFDLFLVASLALLYLAARHTLRLQPPAALVCVLATAVVMAGLQILAVP